MPSILFIPAHSSFFQNSLFSQLFIFEIKINNLVNSWGKNNNFSGIILYHYFGTIGVFSFSGSKAYLPTYVNLKHPTFWCFLGKGHVCILNLFLSITMQWRKRSLTCIFLTWYCLQRMLLIFEYLSWIHHWTNFIILLN